VPAPTLLVVPNVSEGRDAAAVAAIAEAFAGTDGAPDGSDGVRLLDRHSDPDHHRSVVTLAGPQGELARHVLAGARAALDRIDVMGGAGAAGQHPHVGALDVVPFVYLRARYRGAACAEALAAADLLARELALPVFLYGELTASAGEPGRTRAELRRGGAGGLAARMAADPPLRPDFGPARPHPSAGAVLVAARPPLVAFNLVLAPPATVAEARSIAAAIREGGEAGLPGLRAIGVALSDGSGQVSMNVERPGELTLAAVVDAVRARATVASAELVGLAPRAALEGFPQDVPMPAFDPARHVIENALGC
jgi:glutamate formiminotransferase/glutamate formiminotransferase/formiminotetrahydrofolate cyclodeaminase